jgi:hypothetical protein
VKKRYPVYCLCRKRIFYLGIFYVSLFLQKHVATRFIH